eukprot:s1216_g11.t1
MAPWLRLLCLWGPPVAVAADDSLDFLDCSGDTFHPAWQRFKDWRDPGRRKGRETGDFRPDAASLRQALEEPGSPGLEAKVDEDDVADAEEVLQELEKRQKAFAQLDAAKEAESIDQLVEALKQAEEILEEDTGEDELEPYREALLEQRQVFARNALEQAVKSRSIPALKEAMQLAELAEMEDSEEVLQSHRVLAEEMVLRALKGLNISDDLRRALQDSRFRYEAQQWQPEVERLPGALRDKDPTEFAIAIRLSEMKGSPSDLQNYQIMAEELLAQAKDGILPSQILRTAIEESGPFQRIFDQQSNGFARK